MPVVTTLSGRCVSATFRLVPLTPAIPNHAPIKITGIAITKWSTGIVRLRTDMTIAKSGKPGMRNFGCGEIHILNRNRKNPQPETIPRILVIFLPFSLPYFFQTSDDPLTKNELAPSHIFPLYKSKTICYFPSFSASILVNSFALGIEDQNIFESIAILLRSYWILVNIPL